LCCCVSVVVTYPLSAITLAVISVPTKANLQDIALLTTPTGLVSRQHFNNFGNKDGGQTWQPINLELDDQKYLFSSVSFAQEGDCRRALYFYTLTMGAVHGRAFR